MRNIYSSDENFDIYFIANFDHWVDDEGLTLPLEYKISNSQTKSAPINDPDPMWNQDFWNNGGWRDSDVGYANTLLGKVDPVYKSKFEKEIPWYRSYRDSLVSDPITGSPALKISQAKNSVNSYYGESAMVRMPSGTKYKELYYTFNVMFNPEFVPNQGGKILGFLGGPPYEGQPSKLPDETEGFAARVMWDKGGFNSYFAYWNDPKFEDARARSQLPPDHEDYFDPDKIIYPAKQQWDEFQPTCIDCDSGDSLQYNADGSFMPRWDEATPRWYNVTYRIVMHTGNNSDGFFEGYINGRLIHRITNMRWHYPPGWPRNGINGLRISGFFGGSGWNLRALKDSWWIYDDITLFMYTDNYIQSHSTIKEGSFNDNNTVLDLPANVWPKE